MEELIFEELIDLCKKDNVELSTEEISNIVDGSIGLNRSLDNLEDTDFSELNFKEIKYLVNFKLCSTALKYEDNKKISSTLIKILEVLPTLRIGYSGKGKDILAYFETSRNLTNCLLDSGSTKNDFDLVNSTRLWKNAVNLDSLNSSDGLFTSENKIEFLRTATTKIGIFYSLSKTEHDFETGKIKELLNFLKELLDEEVQHKLNECFLNIAEDEVFEEFGYTIFDETLFPDLIVEKALLFILNFFYTKLQFYPSSTSNRSKDEEIWTNMLENKFDTLILVDYEIKEILEEFTNFVVSNVKKFINSFESFDDYNWEKTEARVVIACIKIGTFCSINLPDFPENFITLIEQILKNTELIKIHNVVLEAMCIRLKKNEKETLDFSGILNSYIKNLYTFDIDVDPSLINSISKLICGTSKLRGSTLGFIASLIDTRKSDFKKNLIIKIIVNVLTNTKDKEAHLFVLSFFLKLKGISDKNNFHNELISISRNSPESVLEEILLVLHNDAKLKVNQLIFIYKELSNNFYNIEQYERVLENGLSTSIKLLSKSQLESLPSEEFYEFFVIFTKLLKKAPIDYDFSRNSTKFRNLSILLVITDFRRKSKMSQDLKNSFIIYAQCSPLLINNFVNINEIEQDIDQNQNISKIKIDKRLSEYCSTKNLRLAEKIVLLGIYDIELIKITNKSAINIFEYYKIPNLLNPFYEGLISISKKLWKKISQVESLKLLTSDECFFVQFKIIMSYFLSDIKIVRENSIYFINEIIKKFPYFLFKEDFIFFVLKLCDFSCFYSKCEYLYEYETEFENITIHQSDSLRCREMFFEELIINVNKWFEKLRNFDNDLLNSLFQNYLLQNMTDNGVNYDIELISNNLFVNNKNTNNDKSKNETKIISNLLNVSYALGQRYMGEENEVVAELEKISKDPHKLEKQYHRTLWKGAALVVSLPQLNYELLYNLCWIPINVFTQKSTTIAVDIWSWLGTKSSGCEQFILSQFNYIWAYTLENENGIYNKKLKFVSPFEKRIDYTQTDILKNKKKNNELRDLCSCHENLIGYIHKILPRIKEDNCKLEILMETLKFILKNNDKIIYNPLVRNIKYEIYILCVEVLNYEFDLCLLQLFYKSIFEWFSIDFNFMDQERSCVIRELKNMTKFAEILDNFEIDEQDLIPKFESMNITHKEKQMIGSENYFKKCKLLIQLLVENELLTLHVFYDPAYTHQDFILPPQIGSVEKRMTNESWTNMIVFAYENNEKLSLGFYNRFGTYYNMKEKFMFLVLQNPSKFIDCSRVITLFPKNELRGLGKFINFWNCVIPTTALCFLESNDTYILSYIIRCLYNFPVDQVFLFIPQLVQSLKYDYYGYIELYILEAAKISQYFAHQIIWNMKANFYRDENASIPSEIKHKLDKIIHEIVENLSGEDKVFYENEFGFFDEITSISGKLKPFIKKSKPEKKQKIDEEMAKIKTREKAYLPSHPEGEVVDIDYKSGRPLQSHAKAPFMATFKILKKHDDEEQKEEFVWLSAIFKVGDDCRQDVLALQLIAVFKSIFEQANLNLYVFPYNVVATACGCGVIDAIPNSISRDQIGREKVNSLYQYFITKFGQENTSEFKKARINFVYSLAAYSVISYLLQIKDRHNGNLMIDGEGHLIHIDFGFLFDISPGGINFESSPFKLTTEFLEVMGKSPENNMYSLFCELCVKGYLVSRQYAEEISQIVSLMIPSNLPCFKDQTIDNLKYRFQQEKSPKQAANFMISKIRDSYENKRTVWYDSFQKATNGIPY